MPRKTKRKTKNNGKGAVSTAQAVTKSTQTPQVHLSAEVEWESLTDKEVSFASQGNLAQQMRTMIDLRVDLSHQVKAAKAQQRTQLNSPSDKSTTYDTERRRTQCQMSPTSILEVVRTRVAERMWQLPLSEDYMYTSDKELTSGEEQHATCRCRPLKSSMDRPGVAIVVNNIT